MLHVTLLLQTLSADSNLWSRHRVAPAGNSLEATLRGTIVPLAAIPSLPTPLATVNESTPGRKAPTAPSSPSYSSPELSAGMGDVSKRRAAGTETISSASSPDVTSPSGEDGLDANGLRQYRLSLAVESRRFKRYPRQALEQGWSGTAEVRVAVAASGVPQFAQLLRSSGHELLDAAALDMINNAALHAVVPSSLRGRTFSVPLPVSFSVDSE
ncbi:MAG: TonB family protein [Proteobacteria bacterium]|nr:TonB family protein [Pseudomonadota bacterium]